MNALQGYGLLRVIARVFKFLAWVILVLGIVGLIVALVSLGGAGDPLLRVIWTVGAILLPVMAISWFVQFYAIGSVLSLLLDIEENTRVLAVRAVEK